MCSHPSGETSGRDRAIAAFHRVSGLQRPRQLHGVPEDDDGGEQIHAGDAVMLAFGGTVADFTAAVEADCPLQRMMSFAFVEPGAFGHAVGVRHPDPVDHEQGALDATDFPQGCRELVLPRIGGEFPQNLAWRDGPGSNGGGDAQDVGQLRSIMAWLAFRRSTLAGAPGRPTD